MKTKELIRRLQEADPSGEMECCVQNADIHFVGVEPAYWDGCLQVLKRDEDNPYYNITGAKYTTHGNKLVIHPLSVADAIFEDQDLPVEFDMDEHWAERYKKSVEERRKETQDICNGVERDSFVEYLKKRLLNFGEDFSKEEIEAAAVEFYNANMDHRDPMPQDIIKTKVKQVIGGKECEVWASWNERRHLQWDREIVVDFVDGKLTLRKVK